MYFHDSTKGGVVPMELAKMIRNPLTVNSRIFIGNISNGIDQTDLETIFGKHGNILGVVLNRGFAFVQYSDDEAAMLAIIKECGRPYRGRNLDVKQARAFPSGGVYASGGGGGGSGRLDRERERSPHEFGGDTFRDRSPDRRMRLDDRRGGGGSIGARDYGDWLDRERDRFESFEAREGDRFYGSRDNSYEDNFRPAPSDHSRDFGPPAPYREMPPAADFPTAGNVANVDRTNDCEIIVVTKSTTDYAEFIERRLKKVGLTVDLLFPNEEVPLGRVLANISGRGTLYAIVVTHQNEEHRSLTLNILHGQPQEHRNMPQEDAITLISRNFDSYMRGEKGLAVVPAGGLVAVPDKHPEAIQTLLNLLRENRQLTVLQYDKVIRYLQERREVQVKVELGETNSSPLAGDGPTSKQQAELQNRILTILNKNIDSNKVAPLPMPVPTPAPRPTPLLNDPTVQRALDSLIQGDLLNKLGGGGGGGLQGAQGGGALFGAFASTGQRKF